MCLETLEGVESIGGFSVIHGVPTDDEGKVSWKDFYARRKECPIFVAHDENLISFRLQNGPIKEVGVNGCQAVTIIQAAELIIQGLNKLYPCKNNEDTISYLKKAIDCQHNRTIDRKLRGVEGYSEV